MPSNSQNILDYHAEQNRRRREGWEPQTPGNRKPRSGFKTKVCHCQPPSLCKLSERYPEIEWVPLRRFVEKYHEEYGVTRNTIYYLFYSHKNFLATNRFQGKRYVAIIPECEDEFFEWLRRNRQKRKPKKRSIHFDGYEHRPRL